MKLIKQFKINEKIYDNFSSICTLNKVEESTIVEEYIKKYIIDSYVINTEVNYKLRYNGSDTVKILSKEDDFILLDNGNKISIFDFDNIYINDDEIVNETLKDLGSDKIDLDVEQVKPDFLNSSADIFVELKPFMEKINNTEIDKS